MHECDTCDEDACRKTCTTSSRSGRRCCRLCAAEDSSFSDIDPDPDVAVVSEGVPEGAPLPEVRHEGKDLHHCSGLSDYWQQAEWGEEKRLTENPAADVAARVPELPFEGLWCKSSGGHGR